MSKTNWWSEATAAFKQGWRRNLAFLIVSAVIAFFISSSIRAGKEREEKRTPEQIAEECILQNSEKVMVNGHHIVYDDGVPLMTGNTFNPAKTRKFVIVVVNGKELIQWTQSYGDFLNQIKGKAKIGYQSSNPNFVVKCCIDDATARMLLKQDLDLMYQSVRFKYSPYFDKLNRFQQGALLAYYYEVGSGRQFKIYKLLQTRPNDAWMGMENADPKKLLEFKKLYQRQDKTRTN